MYSFKNSGKKEPVHLATCPEVSEKYIDTRVNSQKGDDEDIESPLERLRHAPPWRIITTRDLAQTLGIDIQALNQRVYRGKAPPSLPTEWFRGRAKFYLVSTVRQWLGDEGTFEAMCLDYLVAACGEEIAAWSREELDAFVWDLAMSDAARVPWTNDGRPAFHEVLAIRSNE